MKQDNDYPDWFLWICEKGVALFLFGSVSLLMGLVAAGWYLDRRLDQVEDRIQYAPPSSYQVPNLDDYAVDNFDVGTLPVRKLIYVPAYSHVYYLGGAAYSLETTLSIRNVDLNNAVYLTYVKYFDTTGKLVKTHLDETIRLGPLQTIEFLVERQDSSGGSGANFLIEWLGDHNTNKPLVEAVMVGTSGTQGIGFGRTGIEISDSNSEPPE